MKAITQAGYGGPDQLTLSEHPEPKVGPSEVLIEVKAAGVNPVDWKLGAGYLDPMMEVQFPLVPGWDVAGVVSALGPDVPEFAVGDEVYGYVRKDSAHLGAYAERVSANVRMLARKPAALSWTEAAGVPLAGLTALQSIDRVSVAAGDTVLVHGAAGGVGSLGVQIAVARGARVIGTASERNHEFLRSLGVEPITYGDGLADRVRALAPEGVDVVLDFVGGGAVHASAEVHKTPSRLVSIADGDAAGLGGHVLWARPDSARLAELARLADDGKLAVHVAHELPLAEAARAWELSQEGRTRGKIVLTV
ncbi:NADP-dependent oxidoreductase [Amycolatopsis sp. 195334CR]|uniref:NADP-dependent oxidoreductase n=1 Tax=Amycolatopsis sp. 195334CR TaxID=2814588 RepID=UPI001A8DB052|nr:NADP-dependent oxidoreductase [Amycolatopsis sp. 195334CR]MBN6039687.1 NADP-dependent oxidoreductase [Amycolatopsis sp. 195334CR]